MRALLAAVTIMLINCNALTPVSCPMLATSPIANHGTQLNTAANAISLAHSLTIY
jgi:hypothetical protein